MKDLLKAIKQYAKELYANRGQKIKIFNPYYPWIETIWFREYIQNKFVSNKDVIAVFGTYGHINETIKICGFKKIIYCTFENVHAPDSPWLKCEHLFLSNPKVKLSIGFDYLSNPKYVRFPLWILRHFSPNDTLEIIRQKINLLNDLQGRRNRKKSCAMICHYDYYGDRAVFADMLESVVDMSYPSSFRHNDDDLKSDKFGDDKMAYLRQFKFNLCPENTDSEGYVTEKIFDSIAAGCIPIYWGSGNNPEPGILNKDSFLCIDPHGDNTATLTKIKQMCEDDTAYESFLKPFFTPEAPELIYEMFLDLDRHLKNVINE